MLDIVKRDLGPTEEGIEEQVDEGGGGEEGGMSDMYSSDDESYDSGDDLEELEEEEVEEDDDDEDDEDYEEQDEGGGGWSGEESEVEGEGVEGDGYDDRPRPQPPLEVSSTLPEEAGGAEFGSSFLKDEVRYPPTAVEGVGADEWKGGDSGCTHHDDVYSSPSVRASLTAEEAASLHAVATRGGVPPDDKVALRGSFLFEPQGDLEQQLAAAWEGAGEG